MFNAKVIAVRLWRTAITFARRVFARIALMAIRFCASRKISQKRSRLIYCMTLFLAKIFLVTMSHQFYKIPLAKQGGFCKTQRLSRTPLRGAHESSLLGAFFVSRSERPRFRFAKPRKTLGVDLLYNVVLGKNLLGHDITPVERNPPCFTRGISFNAKALVCAASRLDERSWRGAFFVSRSERPGFRFAKPR